MIQSLKLGLSSEPLFQSNTQAIDHASDELVLSQSCYGRTGDQEVQQLFSMNKEMGTGRLACHHGLHLTLGRGEGSSTKSMCNDSPSAAKAGDPSSNRNFGRVCVACNTSKTPLWRGGPHGPKSLCNACGIRYRKARRALAAAAVTDFDGSFPSNPSILILNRPDMVSKKRKQCRDPAKLAHRRREKLGMTTYTTDFMNQDAGDELFCSSARLSKRSAFHRVLPKDEEDAAMLLMALSCGLVHG